MIKEELAEQYCNREGLSWENEYAKESFLAGFDAAQLKWISVEEELPDNDRAVLVWVNNLETPRWSGYKLGSYIDSKWYCDGGRKSHEVVTQWFSFPTIKK